MRIQYVLFVFGILLLGACHDVAVGYLKADNAVYAPDSIVIRKVLDPELDGIRQENQAPWMTLPIQGILGTPPIYFEIENVTSVNATDADLFKSELSIMGGGIMYYPLEGKAPVGKYVVSVRVWNEGYSCVKKDVFTFIVK